MLDSVCNCLDFLQGLKMKTEIIAVNINYHYICLDK